MTSPDRLRVLHVCTGNICRSPLAEALMREGLRARLGAGADAVLVESAGTWGHSGSPMEPFALSTLTGRGIDAASFRARELVAEHVAAADLVLTATREHRAAAVVLQPRAGARTFTLREFARLCAAVRAEAAADAALLPEGDVVARGRALVARAAAHRAELPQAGPRDDLADPYHAPETTFRACAALVEQALQVPLDLLAGPVR